MSREYFDDSAWMETDYAGEYRDNADHFVLGRRTQLFVLQSFYRYFLSKRMPFEVLDLGCGDGELAANVRAVAPHARLTLVDGSADMLDAARARYADQPEATFVQATFAELIADSSTLGQYDLVVSGFAIHHLYLPEKIALFNVVFEHLKPGGAFVNIDTVFPTEDEALIDWYYKLWEEWIVARGERFNLAENFSGVPNEARYKAENKLSTLSSQLESLKSIGFTQVGSHYQNSIFVVFSGRKPT